MNYTYMAHGRDYVHRSSIPLLDMIFATKVILMASSLYWQ